MLQFAQSLQRSKSLSSTTAIIIRPARTADIDALLALEQTSFNTDRLTRPRLRHWVTAQNGILLVAADREDQLLGYCLVLLRRNSTRARVYSLATASAVRGQGIGTRLLQQAEAAAAGRGCSAMYLEVAEANRNAISLYEKLDYRPCGFSAGYYENGENAVRMEKSLK